DDERKAQELTNRIEEFARANNYSRAAELAQELTVLRQQKQGKNHWETANALLLAKLMRRLDGLPERNRNDFRSSIAMTIEATQYYERGQYDKSENLYRRALVLRREAIGERNLHVAESYCSLARSLCAQNKHAAVADSLERGLALSLELVGELHP